MARYSNNELWSFYTRLILLVLLLHQNLNGIYAKRLPAENLTACQHLRRAESRRAKSLTDTGTKVRIPRCNKLGEFEPIQCMNETTGTDCWCVDEYGVEIPETRHQHKGSVNCTEPQHCPESHCRMFCPFGFDRDLKTGCSICKCRDPCDGVVCPGGQTCYQQEVKCKDEPCPPIPTCKKSRSFSNYCPSGFPFTIEDTGKPYLCGIGDEKPQCPPLFDCLVEPGNDYGVCCPSSLKYTKPGVCPNSKDTTHTDSTDGYICGTPCSHDLECPQMEKCCYRKGCQMICQQPVNVTICHKEKVLSEILSINEREGKGYIPDCNGPGGLYTPKQCSRNGLVCWCVDPKTGHKIRGTMGAANTVDCDGVENMIARSLGRSFNVNQCDTNICAAVCQYGFKNDHNGCPSCECSEPCEGFICPEGSYCEVAKDPKCSSGSSMCDSIPFCKPNLLYSNPCDNGTPLVNNGTGEVEYCMDEEIEDYTIKSFYDEEKREGRSMINRITCPSEYKCTKVYRESVKVCCPKPSQKQESEIESDSRQQSMCEYLRDFSERMEGTEEGMQLAMPSPKCDTDGSYKPRQCQLKKIQVTQNERRKIMEENSIRNMQKLISSRHKRNVQNLKLHQVEKNTRISEIEPIVMARRAKIIDNGRLNQQSLTNDIKKLGHDYVESKDINRKMVEVEIEECWCVDGFGTEIPRSRGFNVTNEDCIRLRDSIECLDTTCRMGCDYGFTLDPETRCPACQCRDPCDGIDCGSTKECRVVDVSCDDEYCPPVPACLPKKSGQCPYLVPPGSENSDVNTCDYECRLDSHCDGTKRCCSNGCGTQCVEPEMKTACQHLQTIQVHQASELGIPAKQTYITQCDEITGKWKPVQCGPDNICWCVDENGQEISGTRIQGKLPVCKHNSAFECPLRKCEPCENGYKTDDRGCQICECRNLCDEISCSGDEECQLISVECVDNPCPKMPVCVPKRESVCPEGSPLKMGDTEVLCGPQNGNDNCPTTHVCQLNPVTHRGVCCSKTRDVCFESIDDSCLAGGASQLNITKWRFNPKLNKCVPVAIEVGQMSCQSKNLFHSETACNSVCPVLTQCERLKLKNNLAARRTGPSSVWFQPRCDPITGHWSPVQCLAKQPAIEGKSFESSESIPNEVCWCADKKGAPIKGTLTRDLEPICNHRQARQRISAEEIMGDTLIEDLIRQMTLLVDTDENESKQTESPVIPEVSSITEKILEAVTSILDSESLMQSTMKLMKTTTRCRALSETAQFQVSCDENGGFHPMQCNGDQCWCVDAAGNQLPSTNTFAIGTQTCLYIPVDSVAIELHLLNESKSIIKNLYDVLKTELQNLLSNNLENLRVHENADGSVLVRFELHDDHKIDTAFAIEEMVKQSNFILGHGKLRPDITQSRFIHYSRQLPIAEAAKSSLENTLQTTVFILATSSAFLVSLLVVFMMLKRGKKKITLTYPNNRVLGNADKILDYSSPIFVLNAEDIEKPKTTV